MSARLAPLYGQRVSCGASSVQGSALTNQRRRRGAAALRGAGESPSQWLHARFPLVQPSITTVFAWPLFGQSLHGPFSVGGLGSCRFLDPDAFNGCPFFQIGEDITYMSQDRAAPMWEAVAAGSVQAHLR